METKYHIKKHMKALICCLLLFSFSAKSEFIFSSGVNTAHKNAIAQDINFLKNFQFKKEAGAEILKVMELDSLDAQTLTDWLFARASYIIHDQKFTKLKIYEV